MELYQIYQEFQGDLLRYARSLTHHQDQAEDLVQQCYLKSLDYLDLFEQLHPNQIKSWFFSAVKRLFIDEWRKQRRMVDSPTALEAQLNNLADQQEGKWLEAIAVRVALDKLEEPERRLFLMRYALGYSSLEIGEKLEINPSTVRNQLARAKERFIAHYARLNY